MIGSRNIFDQSESLSERKTCLHGIGVPGDVIFSDQFQAPAGLPGKRVTCKMPRKGKKDENASVQSDRRKVSLFFFNKPSIY